MFWIGDRLGPLERACIRSVVRQGHPLALYCYQPPSGIPELVEIRDAEQILPQSRVMRHKRGSVALFSDWFRYELQKRALGTWLDTDVYLLKALDIPGPYILAEYEPGKINGSILRLPADSPMVPALLAPFESATMPDWLPWRSYVPGRLRQLMTGRVDLSRLAWGSVGTYALTALAHRFGLASQAQPPDVFHPVSWRNAHWIADPTISLEQIITGRTIGIHLWNECIKDIKNEPAAKGSFLARLQDEGRE